MIPEIGLIISGYVILRCLEMIARPATHWSSAGWRVAVCVLAGLAIVGTLVLSVDLILGSPTTPATTGTAITLSPQPTTGHQEPDSLSPYPAKSTEVLLGETEGILKGKQDRK